MPADAFDWTVMLVGAALAPLGLWLAWRSLLADPGRGGRRCPRCWYDLRGTPGMRCSECGYQAASERSLRRTRRHWPAAAAGLLLALAGASGLATPKVRHDGFLSLVPTTALLLAAPMDDWPAPRPSLVAAELERRKAAASLWGWQWRYVARKCLRYRDRWPADVPLVVEVQTPAWAIRAPDGGALSVQGDYTGIVGQYSVGHLPRGDQHVPVTFHVRELGFGRQPVVWTGALFVPIQIVDSIDEVVLPVSGEEIDALVKRAISVRIAARRPGGDDPVLSVSFDRDLDPKLANLSGPFGLGIEVLRPGHAPERLRRASWSVSYRWGDSVYFGPWGEADELTLAYFADNSDWTLRIRGDAEMALRDWDRSEYWDGQIELTPSEVTIVR